MHLQIYLYLLSKKYLMKKFYQKKIEETKNVLISYLPSTKNLIFSSIDFDRYITLLITYINEFSNSLRKYQEK
jgi:hypothetical protein